MSSSGRKIKRGISCEICGSGDSAVIATKIREGKGRIVRCNRCKLIFQDTRLSGAGLKKYYNEEYQVSNSLTLGRKQSPRQRFEDKIGTLGDTLGKLRPLLRKNMSVLEIGCGTGEVLHSIRPYVREVAGIELNRQFARFIENELGIAAYSDDVNDIDFGGEKFDLIICNATLDHLPNPLETVLTMKRLAAPRGVIYIEVPNADEALNRFIPGDKRKKFNRFFWHRAHLFYFTKATITALLGRAGLETKVSCYHKYTLKNFLNWYFSGEPQRTFIGGATDIRFFAGSSAFEKRMNAAFIAAERTFKKAMSGTFGGDTLCCVCRKR